MAYKIGDKYYNITKKEAKSVLNKKEYSFYIKGQPIPLYGSSDLWLLSNSIHSKIEKALVDGKISGFELGSVARSTASYVISDDLGINGVFCHADGKMYDSKSQYYKSVKEKGYEVVGNDLPVEAFEAKPVYNVSDKEMHKDISEAMKQLGY